MSTDRFPLLALTLFGLSCAANAGLINATAPPCAGGNLQSYIALGSAGCRGPGPTSTALTYFDFDFTVKYPETTQTVGLADASNINVTPPAAPGEQISFNSIYFDVPTLERAVYIIDYTIDPPPDILPGFDLELDTFTPVQPGKATVTAFVCVGGNYDDGLCSEVETATYSELIPYTLIVFHNGLPLGSVQLTQSVTFNEPTNYIDVRLIIDLDARRGGTSQISGVGTSVPVPPQYAVPEPGTWAMLGAGLSGLALFRRRRG